MGPFLQFLYPLLLFLRSCPSYKMSAAALTADMDAAVAPTTLIRASVQGIVYLIDSPTGNVYTYNLENPTFVGVLEKIPEEDKHLISKTNGCLATARVKYRPDIKAVMAALREEAGPWVPAGTSDA